MLLLSCSVETTPCPVGSEIWVQSASISSLADVGITPEQIIFVIGWGFGVVMLGFLLGYVLGLSLGLIKKV